jgi:hypothetical protein
VVYDEIEDIGRRTAKSSVHWVKMTRLVLRDEETVRGVTYVLRMLDNRTRALVDNQLSGKMFWGNRPNLNEEMRVLSKQPLVGIRIAFRHNGNIIRQPLSDRTCLVYTFVNIPI